MIPICATCGRRRMQRECIECYSRTVKRKPWSIEEEDLLAELYGTTRVESIQYQLFVQLESARKCRAILCHAARMGLECATNHDGVKLSEAAAECGVSMWQLRNLIAQKKIRVIRGPLHCIPASEIPKIKKLYPQTEDMLNTVQVGDLLGYDRKYIHRLFGQGAFKGAIRRGSQWWAPRAAVEKMARDFKASGRVQMRWK